MRPVLFMKTFMWKTVIYHRPHMFIFRLCDTYGIKYILKTIYYNIDCSVVLVLTARYRFEPFAGDMSCSVWPLHGFADSAYHHMCYTRHGGDVSSQIG